MRRKVVAAAVVVIVLALAGIGGYVAHDETETPQSGSQPGTEQGEVREGTALEEWRNHDIPIYELSPVQAGKRLTRGNCQGTGPGTLTHPPMDPKDMAVIVPYGSTTGGHVTPTDHQYFYPEDLDADRDTYPVYAMSDGHVYMIDYADTFVEESAETGGDYGVYITISCTHMYYETILSSLSPRLQEVFEENRNRDRAHVFVQVEAGERIGWLGGNTVDFAVLDTEKLLTGFISPELYTEEEKFFTADPFDYYTPELAQTLLEKYPRTAEPLGGKIDYDLEGRLRGNWFIQGTGGYRGTVEGEEPPPRYWRTHLSIHPDHMDPGATTISVGDFDGEAEQFATPRDSPDPAGVGVGDGVVRYTLADREYVKEDGSGWDGLSPAEELTVAPQMERGCALFQMPSNRTLRAEFFPGASCSSVDGFTEDARTYER